MAVVRLRSGDLKQALEAGALSVHYQPQVHVPTGKLGGVEAFVRWPHPAYGMIGPSDIIPLVEQGRFHLDFDRWVVNALCEQVRNWDGEGFDVPIVAANLWAQTLRSGKAVDMLRERILAAGVSPKTIEIACP